MQPVKQLTRSWHKSATARKTFKIVCIEKYRQPSRLIIRHSGFGQRHTKTLHAQETFVYLSPAVTFPQPGIHRMITVYPAIFIRP